MTGPSPVRRARPVLAWSLCALAVALFAIALWLWVLSAAEPLTPDILLFPFAYLTFCVVGALIVSRQPANRIGGLALLVGVVAAAVATLDSFARVPQPLPGQEWAALLAAAGFPTTLGPILLLLLLFPTGRLASPRWRIAVAALTVGVALLALGNLLSPTFADFPAIPNPIGIPALAGSPLEHGGVGWLLVLFVAVAAPVGLVPRLRAARGIERAQLKWVTWAAAVHGASWVLLALDLPGIAGDLVYSAVFATLALIPIAAGIAILRYRLYDIDLVIRRTVVYGLVIVLLGAVYVGLVLALQAMLSEATGGGTVPVALSTLATAALFGPVRSRIRALVDRRFYRTRYRAEVTVEAFGRRLRSEGELEALRDELVSLVGETVQPRGAGVWVRTRR
jgi:hypothetical protein